MGQYKKVIIIPAYNEAKTIGMVVASVINHGVVVVVDDASEDHTGEIAKSAGAIIIKHTKNLGYEAALNVGMQKAYEIGGDIMLTFDADGQHSAKDIPRVLSKMKSGVDMVIGVRDQKPRISEQIFALYTNFFYNIEDPLCGMKAYSRALYAKYGRFDTMEAVGTELTMLAAKNKHEIKQVKIFTNNRQGQARFAHGLSAEYKILRAMFCVIWKVRKEIG